MKCPKCGPVTMALVCQKCKSFLKEDIASDTFIITFTQNGYPDEGIEHSTVIEIHYGPEKKVIEYAKMKIAAREYSSYEVEDFAKWVEYHSVA